MVIKINNTNYEVATSLRVAYNLETSRKNKIGDILSKFDDMNVTDLISLIYEGFKVKNKDVSQKEFVDMVLDSDDMGFVNLQTEVQVFLTLLLDANNNEADIRAKIDDIRNDKVKELEEEPEKN